MDTHLVHIFFFITLHKLLGCVSGIKSLTRTSDLILGSDILLGALKMCIVKFSTSNYKLSNENLFLWK